VIRRVKIVSIITTAETDIGKLLHALVGAANLFAKVSPAVQAAALASLQTVITAVQDAGGAVGDEGLNFTLDSQTVTDIKAVISQFEKDLTALGIKLQASAQ
jgi:hypothetical protein